MIAYMVVDLALHAILSSAMNGDEWSASRGVIREGTPRHIL
jgi:hypothetical protein